MQSPSVVSLSASHAAAAESTAARRAAAVVPPAISTPQRTTTAARPSPERSSFTPLLLGLLALCGFLGHQGWLALQDRDALLAAQAGQQASVDSAAKLRASLDTLAADTQRLATAGNAGAAALVAQLKQRGITIDPNAAAAGAAVPSSR